MATKTLKFDNYDITRYSRGTDYVKLQGIKKTTQDAEIVLTTNVRPTTGLGAGIDELIGKVGYDDTSALMRIPISFDLQNRISGALNALISAQRRYLFHARSREELIFEFSPVQVWKHPTNPTIYNWKVGIQTYLATAKPEYLGGSVG